MWNGEGSADDIIESKGLKQITDTGAIEAMVDEVIAGNPEQFAQLKAGKDIAENECATNPIAAQFHLGNRLGVSGTPAIFTESGKQLGGYVPARVIAQRLGLED